MTPFEWIYATHVTVTVVLVAWAAWLTVRGVRWGHVERVKLTLAEQEESLASLFDKLNTVLARWRKREQRERERAPDETPAVAPSSRKAELYHRMAELRGINVNGQRDLPWQAEEVGDVAGD